MKPHSILVLLALNLTAAGLIYGSPVPQSPPPSPAEDQTHRSSSPRAIGSSTTTHPFDSDEEYNSAEAAALEQDFHDLQSAISPKLFMFLQRLAMISPELLEKGEARLAAIKAMGHDEVEEVIGAGSNANPEEAKQFRADLAKVAKLVSKYPAIKKLINISFDEGGVGVGAGAGSGSTTPMSPASAEALMDEIDPFFEEFSRVDKELSRYPEWNRYWSYWFKRYGDYMEKYG